MNKMEKEREGIKSGDYGTRGSEKITREKPDGGAAQSSEKAPGGRRKQKESAPIRIIDAESVRRAQATLRRYKLGKANLERRIVENEKWYRVRHRDCMPDKRGSINPNSAWLFNCIANKHASAMDTIPAPRVLPREEGDREEAEKLSAILPIIFDRCDFEQVYSDAWDRKCRGGTGVYGVFWDKSAMGGLGDITVRDIDPLSLYWEPGIRDIQRSRNLFSVGLCDLDALMSAYPFLEGRLDTCTPDIAVHEGEDPVDTTGKVAVVDWYYKKVLPGGREILHYCKYVGEEVLYATENDPALRERGLYDHGMYPFVFDPLFTMPDSPAGFGYIDIGKDCQAYIDRAGQAVMKNMLAGAAPRVLISEDSPINEDEYSDMTCDIVHVAGAITDSTVRPLPSVSLDGIYITALRDKIDELKETTGNRDVTSGGTAAGVTAASAIAAMQEAGSRLERDSSRASYRAFKRVCLMVIDLIRQFYTASRCFRLIGDDGSEHFIRYDRGGIAPQRSEVLGIELGESSPLFDIEISAEKSSPYSRAAQNELALSFFKAGFFDPQKASEALSCLDMMDFDRKAQVIGRIRRDRDAYLRSTLEAVIRSGAAEYAGYGATGSGTIGTAMSNGTAAQNGIGASGSSSDAETHSESAATRKARQSFAVGAEP